jgi:cell division septum initiation protein DivIVA
VDGFLDLVAERLEEVVRENATLKERTTQLAASIDSFRERERAMNDALISAQQLREETRAQAERDAELTLREARAESERLLAEGRRQLASIEDALKRVQSQRMNYLRSLRALVERHLSEVEKEEDRLHDLLRADAEPIEPRADARPVTPSDWLTALDQSGPRDAE